MTSEVLKDLLESQNASCQKCAFSNLSQLPSDPAAHSNGYSTSVLSPRILFPTSLARPASSPCF